MGKTLDSVPTTANKKAEEEEVRDDSIISHPLADGYTDDNCIIQIITGSLRTVESQYKSLLGP